MGGGSGVNQRANGCKSCCWLVVGCGREQEGKTCLLGLEFLVLQQCNSGPKNNNDNGNPSTPQVSHKIVSIGHHRVLSCVKEEGGAREKGGKEAEEKKKTMVKIWASWYI